MQYEICIHATWVAWHLGTYVTDLPSLRHVHIVLSYPATSVSLLWARLFLSRFFVEWYFDLRLLVWFVVENSLHAKKNREEQFSSLHAKNNGEERRLKYKDDRSSGAIKTAADGHRHANKCLLTVKHGTRTAMPWLFPKLMTYYSPFCCYCRLLQL